MAEHIHTGVARHYFAVVNPSHIGSALCDETDQLRDELDLCAAERDLCAGLVIELVAVEPWNDDGNCVYCEASRADGEHTESCPWRRARAEVLPHRVRNGVADGE